MLRDQYTLEDVMKVFDVRKASDLMNQHEFDFAEAGVPDEMDSITCLKGAMIIGTGVRLRSLRVGPILRLYRAGAEGWTSSSRNFPCYKLFRTTRKTVFDDWEIHEEIKEAEEQ